MSEIDEPILRFFHVKKQGYRKWMAIICLAAAAGVGLSLLAGPTLVTSLMFLAFLGVGGAKALNYFRSDDPPDARY